MRRLQPESKLSRLSLHKLPMFYYLGRVYCDKTDGLVHEVFTVSVWVLSVLPLTLDCCHK